MAVPNQTPYKKYTANGSTTQFSLGFNCESKDHLIVTIDEVEAVTGSWSLSNGNVIFSVAPGVGKAIELKRNTPASRSTDYQSFNNSFRPQSVNGDFDRLWLKLQELGVANWLLKQYVDKKDDELKAFLLKEIRKQGVALDQLDEYYNYLMQRLAQVAVDKGWDASFVVDGNKTQHEINAEQKDKNLLFNQFMVNLVTPEMFGAKANDPEFDNTSALNDAFATGKSIYSTPDKTYYVNGILNSKGQKLIGGWKIHTSRFNLGTVTTEVTQPDTSVIKMLYVETAYDLSELLFIKALGFNMINHYGYFSGVPADVDGNFWKLLDSAKTAGLKVNLGTENFQAQHNLGEFVQYFQGYEAVFGFSAYDEPGARNLTFATQQARIDTIRANTAKQISFVDNTGADKPFNQKTNYDVDLLFVDWYSHTQTGTLAERIEKDLQDMRYEFGFFKASSKLSRVIPTVGAFTYNNSLAPGAYYATDINQVVGAAEVFGKVGGGNFAMFPWDAESDPATILKVRNSVELQNLARRLCAQDVRKEYITDAYIFGHSNFDRDWGVDCLVDKLVVSDANTDDVSLNKNAYPMELGYGATNTDRKSPDINPTTFYSGIGFKGSDAGLATRIKTHNHVTAYLSYFNVQSLLATEIKLYQTADGGYTHDELFSTSTAGTEIEIKVNVKPIAEYNNLMFRVLTPADTSTHYRKFLRGLVVTTDW